MKTKLYRIPATCAETRLERNALNWLNDSADYNDGAKGRYKDLMHDGCQSGIVNHLIYSVDCRSFLKRHREEVNDLLGEALEEYGTTNPGDFLKDWDASDPLGLNINADRLAWFAFETAAQRVVDRAGIEI